MDSGDESHIQPNICGQFATTHWSLVHAVGIHSRSERITMTIGQMEPAHSEPSPLDRNEITAVVGAMMIVAGVFCPALTLTGSFFATGNTVAVIVLGLAGATGWSIALRRPAAVMWNGVLTVAIVATFGIALWYDKVREPVRTFFGAIQVEIRPAAWILIGIGAVLVGLAGYRAQGCGRQRTKLQTSSQRLMTAGIILATLGCLFAIALTNPVGPMSQGALRRMGQIWDEQLNVVRWVLKTGAMLAVVLSAQVPRLADRLLRTVTGITWLLVGNALFILLSTQVTASLYLTVVWNIACFGLMLWKTNPRRPWTWLERLVLWLPYLTVGVLLLVMGEFSDLIFAAGPPVVVTATGYMICRRAKWTDEATYATMLFVGIPAAGMAFSEVPNEYRETCGLSSPEGRVLLLILFGVLAWSIFLSFCTTSATTRADEGDDILRHPGGIESDSHGGK